MRKRKYKYVSFWSLFKEEFFPTFEQETEQIILEKERLEKIIEERKNKNNIKGDV